MTNIVSPEQEQLAEFIVKTNWDDLPDEVIRTTKLIMLDSIGCALAGMSNDLGRIAVMLANRLGGTAESSIIGMGNKVSCSEAAFANGELIRAVDYDAMLPGGHTPPNVIPPALAMAEVAGASGKDLILGTATGFEVAARVTGALSKGAIITGSKDTNFGMGERGGGASGNFGAVAGAGKVFKLDHDRMLNALGIAGHLCQVLTNTKFTMSPQRAMTKYGVPGWQNTGAVAAVLMSDMGYMGDITVFEQEYGYWKFCGYRGWDSDRITDGLGKTWLFPVVNYKPYPCCRMLHSSLDCFINIINRNHLMPEEIDSVRAYLHPVAESPLFVNRELTNAVDVQFGLHYVLAAAAFRIQMGVEWQDLHILDKPEIHEFVKKISFGEHPEFNQEKLKNPRSHVAKVEVDARGQTFTEDRYYSKGTPGTEFAMTEDELIEKFRHNASRILTKDKTDGAIAAILGLEQVKHVSELMEQICL